MKIKIFLFLAFLSLVIFWSCEKKEPFLKEEGIDSVKSDEDVSDNDSSKKIGNFTLDDFLKENKRLYSSVERIFNSLGREEEKVAQMIVTFGGKLGKSDDYVEKVIREKKAGGVLLLGGSKEYMISTIQKLKKEIKKNNYLPLFFMVDGEPSLISNKISGIPKFEPTSDIKAEKNRTVAKKITSVIKEMGFNMNLAPVCDLPNNKEIIGNRSYGSKERIIKLSTEFIEESHKQNVLATAKHFPGHGRVKGDSHKELVYLSGKLDEEIQIFKSIIDSGVLCIMVGHIAVKDGPYSTDGKPATLSPKIINDLLKKQLGFKGLIITDAMNMGAVSKLSKPSLNAVIAGNDLILFPSDERVLISSIVEKMKNDENFKKQIYNSVKKIIRMKLCLGLMN